MSKHNDDNVLGLDAAAAYLGMTSQELMRLCRARQGPYRRWDASGNQYFVLRHLNRWKQDRERDHAPLNVRSARGS